VIVAVNVVEMGRNT